MSLSFRKALKAWSDALPSQDTVAGQLCALITAEGASLPTTITSQSHPAEILSAAATVDPDLANLVDTHLAHIEVTAAESARPAAYVHEALAACRDSGRTPAVLSYYTAQAVTGFLIRHSLTEQAGHITALPAYPPGHLQSAADLLEELIRAIGATPEECALITASPASTDTAHRLGAAVIGYATTPAARDQLSEADADCGIPSLADLTLRLRARPLPE